MRILITGISGFIGQALRQELSAHNILFTTRDFKKRNAPGAIYWDPARGEIEAFKLLNIDAVINLAGENIFGIWTNSKKKKILESRLQGTKLLVDSFIYQNSFPKVFIQASGANYYGYNLKEEATENTPAGAGFLAKVCQTAEAESLRLKENTKVTILRITPVIDPRGGVQKLLNLFPVIFQPEYGENFFSYINLSDLIMIIQDSLAGKYSGPVNCVTKYCRLQDFNRQQNKPIIKIPRILFEIFGGELAKEVLLSDLKVKGATRK